MIIKLTKKEVLLIIAAIEILQTNSKFKLFANEDWVKVDEKNVELFDLWQDYKKLLAKFIK